MSDNSTPEGKRDFWDNVGKMLSDADFETVSLKNRITKLRSSLCEIRDQGCQGCSLDENWDCPACIARMTLKNDNETRKK